MNRYDDRVPTPDLRPELEYPSHKNGARSGWRCALLRLGQVKQIAAR